MKTMKKTWYAVQIGEDDAWDWGSYDYDEAVEMAERAANDPDYAGLEVRLLHIDEKYNVCDDIEYYADGRGYQI